MKKFLSEYPELVSEWHPTKNGELKPEDFTYGSNKIIWWLCPKGHEYCSKIKSRTGKNKTNCSFCCGHKVSVDNNLKFLFPEIAKEWHPTKNGELKPEDVTCGSGQKVWWLCPKGHEYYSLISNRTSANKSGCPFCSGHRVSASNNLKFLFPKIAKEWHPTKNGELKPEDVTCGSGQKVWWLCPKGHSYHAQILSRAGQQKTGCLSCSNQKSSPELRILSEFRFIFDDVKNRHKIEGVEIDVYVPKLNLAIEYDGSYFHQGKEQEDLGKNEFLQKRNIEVFRVRCRPLDKITENDLIVKNDDLSKSDLNRVFKKIYSFADSDLKEKINEYFESDHFLNENLFREYLSYFPSPLPEKSLTKNYLNLVNEWDYEKNHPLIPDQFSKGSHKKVWWLCPKRHSYEAAISKRAQREKPQNCPYCSGHRVSADNNLKFLFPEIAKEWHPTKNGELKPEDVTCGSGQKVWWLCPKGHEYDSIINSRTGKDEHNCPFCSGHRVSASNNLKFLFPKIAKEWHPTKNGELKPEDVTPGSEIRVWWLCPERHEYDSRINNRTGKNKTGCQKCKILVFLFPEIAKEWHPTKNGELKPEDVTHGSNKEVWWSCPVGHEYYSLISNRTGKNKTGCPHCYRNSS